MSTPSGKPARPATVYDYAPRYVREQMERDPDDPADMEFADDPRDPPDDPPPAKPRKAEDDRVSPLVPKGPHEDPDGEPHETEDELGDDWDEVYRAEADHPYAEPYDLDLARDRRDAARANNDLEDHLERLAATIRSVRDDADDEADAPSEPEPDPQPPRAARAAVRWPAQPDERAFYDDDVDAPSEPEPEPDPARAARAAVRWPEPSDERAVYVDGVRLPPFLQRAYVPPPTRRESRGAFGLALLALTGACVVAAPMAYWFLAGNPFATASRNDLTKSAAKYDVASVAPALPRPEQQAAPPASLQNPRPVTPTRVTRWSDQMQEAVAQLPPVVEPTPQLPHASVAPEPAPTAPAYALATRPAPSTVAAAPAASAVAPPLPAPEPPRANPVPVPAPSAAVAALAPAPRAAASVPAAPRPAPAPTLDADAVQLLLKQGQDFVADGDLATARIVLRHAAEAGSAAAALALGQTYDPQALAKMRARGVTPDAGEARRWYETAQRLGSGDAAQRLEQLARDQ